MVDPFFIIQTGYRTPPPLSLSLPRNVVYTVSRREWRKKVERVKWRKNPVIKQIFISTSYFQFQRWKKNDFGQQTWGIVILLTGLETVVRNFNFDGDLNGKENGKKSPPPSPYIISNVICVIKKSLFFPITRSNLETLWFFPSLDGGEKGLKQAFGLGEKVLAVTSSIGNMEWNDDKSVFAKIWNLY